MESSAIIQDGLGEKFALGIQFSISFIAGLITALYYVWQLALLLFGVVPVLVVGIGLVMTLVAPQSTVDAYNAAGSAAQEALGAIRTVFAFGAQQKAILPTFMIKFFWGGGDVIFVYCSR